MEHSRLPMHHCRSSLVCREDQRVRHSHVLSPPYSKHDHFCNILSRQGLDAFIYGVRLGLVSAEANHRELCFYLAWTVSAT